jgi:hypothetical protein
MASHRSQPQRQRGTRLQDTADRQISELIRIFSARGEAVLKLSCPGREKLGDGTVAACASLTVESYERIASFLRGRDHGGHNGDHRVETTDLQGLLDRLSDGRTALSLLGSLTDEQLDTVPPASDIKFCDGLRTLEQVVSSLLKHQSHNVEALKAAVESPIL